MLKDRYNRVHNYLRISLTDNCNLRCFYCMPEEDYAFMPSQQLMQKDEIVSLAKLFIANGVNKIRLTGGEPLVRKDAAAIIRALGNLGVELTITTNATRVHHFIDDFVAAGIRSVNISLDTLQPEKFQLITRRDQFFTVKNNIQLLLDGNFKVKVNVVVVKGLNEQEIPDFIEWTRALPIHVRFIEFMPFDGNRWKSNKLVTWKEMLAIITSKYEIEAQENLPNDTSKNYRIKNHLGSFAVISTMSAPFCAGCNRIRLTADGKIKNCLFSQEETDLLSALRSGNDVLGLIEQSILAKQKELGGQFSKDFELINTDDLHNRSMIAIGG
ncbi:MAG: GTP 3',8-cyclase MoaA [Chitinophagaceae bacterium]|nr:GTP 3',8-cyclase MoaA [Chitinophagaceae bacterium]MDP1763212.1 GTP 3',8-cyclase MoaA [Sediminibacterium sp.]MDP1810315.1 GTP 3',8-cyclase MoaA [Sediminibacterium sp.]MDP3128487.1 GTP 3',8-cyclase MoaA [Sediminibacterium sp.]